MSLKLTEQEIKRVKNTTRVFIVVFLVCAIIAGVFYALIPRTKQITALGANEEIIESYIDSHDGETYFLQSKNILCEYDSYTGEKLSEINLTKAIKDKFGEEGAVERSFERWRVSAFSAEAGDYFVANDANGNFFKLVRNDNGELEVCEDFYFIKYNADGKTYSAKEIKGMDVMAGTNDVYALIVENNEFFIEKYDISDFSRGPLVKKFLWDIQLEENNGFKKIQEMKADTGVLAFYAHNDYLYFIKNGGGVLRVSTKLADRAGEDNDFFGKAEEVNEYRKALRETEEYKAIVAGAEAESLAEILADWCLQYTVEEELPFEIRVGEEYKAFTVDDIFELCGEVFDAKAIEDSEKRAEIIDKVKVLFASSVDGERPVYDYADLTSEEKKARFVFNDKVVATFPQEGDITSAKNAAAAIPEEFLNERAPYPEWIASYSEQENSMFIDENVLDEDYYVSFGAGESIVRGMILSKPNNALYYTNASDGYLYVLDLNEITNKNAETGLTTIASNSKKIDGIHCGKGQTFSDFGNGLGYNKFANSLYLKYANERKLTIVDINVKDIKNVGEYKILSTFTGTFDMFTVSGTKDDSVTLVLHQVTKVDKKGIDNNYLYACSYESERFENKPLVTTVFIIFLAFAVVSLFIGLWLLKCSRSEVGIKKVVFIAKDTKKNKFVYLALVPFIVMLILFCYYEAVGAIAMSFFDYTRDKPAWIWNNFANYVKIFNNSKFLPSVLNMLFFLASDIILCIVPPIIFAILLILIRNKVTSSWIRSLMFIPGIIPSIAGMLIWRVGIYGDDGVLNQIVMKLGGEPVNWLLNQDYARWSLIFMGFPFVGGYLIFYGGMMNIPTEYHEAGKLEGLGIIKRFLKIDIPLIMPQIKYIFITTFIASVQNFARTHILKSTVVLTPVQTMYTMMTEQADYGMSSAYATLIFIFLFAAIATNFKMQKQDAMGADL